MREKVKNKNDNQKNIKTGIQFELIVTITNRGYSDFVVESARNAGASGGTIIHGRGTGVHEKESILGVSIQPEKEMVLTLVNKEEKSRIMKAIVEGANLNKEGKGICFSIPVEDVSGINHLLGAGEEKKSKDTKAKDAPQESVEVEDKIKEQKQPKEKKVVSKKTSEKAKTDKKKKD